MTIGLVLPSIPGYSETFFRNKIVGLQQNGIEVILFVNDPKARDLFLDCKVFKAPKLNGNRWQVIFSAFLQLLKMVSVNPKNSWKLYKLNKIDKLSTAQNINQVIANQFLLSEKLDWLHFGFGTMALQRENIAEAIGAKMAVSFRGFDHYVYPIKNKDCYKFLYTKKIKYHVLSEGMKRSLLNNGVEEHNIVKITPAINPKLFKQNKAATTKVLQIKTVARLHWIKGLEYTLEALSLLHQHGIDFQYTIIGEGDEKERLLFAVHQLELTEKVVFAGKLSSEKVKEQLNSTDIYLQYSLQEGFCNAVLEAQAMGLLCIVSDAEGLSENVLDGVTGFVVPKQQPKRLYEKLLEGINLSKSQKEEIKQKAMTRVQQEFTIEKQQQEFLAFYKNK